MTQIELKTYLRTNSKKHNSSKYFDTLKEAQTYCGANRLKYYTLKEVEVTNKFGIEMTSWTYGDYYYKSF